MSSGAECGAWRAMPRAGRVAAAPIQRRLCEAPFSLDRMDADDSPPPRHADRRLRALTMHPSRRRSPHRPIPSSHRHTGRQSPTWLLLARASGGVNGVRSDIARWAKYALPRHCLAADRSHSGGSCAVFEPAPPTLGALGECLSLARLKGSHVHPRVVEHPRAGELG